MISAYDPLRRIYRRRCTPGNFAIITSYLSTTLSHDITSTFNYSRSGHRRSSRLDRLVEVVWQPSLMPDEEMAVLKGLVASVNPAVETRRNFIFTRGVIVIAAVATSCPGSRTAPCTFDGCDARGIKVQRPRRNEPSVDGTRLHATAVSELAQVFRVRNSHTALGRTHGSYDIGQWRYHSKGTAKKSLVGWTRRPRLLETPFRSEIYRLREGVRSSANRTSSSLTVDPDWPRISSLRLVQHRVPDL